MKKLTDYKDEIHKCSKCGLCQSVCPVYNVTGNDCSVSRGKFIMLNGILKGDLKLNKNINKYLDMCLKCNACKDFCPSDIDARKIFLTAKSQYFENCPSAGLIKGFQSKFMFSSVLKLTKIAVNTYRFMKLDRLTSKFYPILQKFKLGKKVILANEFLSRGKEAKRQRGKEELQNKKNYASLHPSIFASKIVYFKGCVNEYINPRTKIATQKILKQMGLEILPIDFECCGVPFLSCGNTEQFKKQAVFNLAQIPDEFDYFLTDCASCQNAFAEYKNYIEDETLLEKIDKILEKSISVNEFIIKNVNSFEFKEKTSFTFHKPCHLENTDFIKEFLAKSKNVEYIEMKEFDKCCGFSGEFAVKNPEISKQISAQKAQNAIDTNADYILTSCPACILGLTQGIIEAKRQRGKEAKQNYIYASMHPCIPASFIEFLAQSKIST